MRRVHARDRPPERRWPLFDVQQSHDPERGGLVPSATICHGERFMTPTPSVRAAGARDRAQPPPDAQATITIAAHPRRDAAAVYQGRHADAARRLPKASGGRVEVKLARWPERNVNGPRGHPPGPLGPGRYRRRAARHGVGRRAVPRWRRPRRPQPDDRAGAPRGRCAGPAPTRSSNASTCGSSAIYPFSGQVLFCRSNGRRPRRSQGAQGAHRSAAR